MAILDAIKLALDEVLDGEPVVLTDTTRFDEDLDLDSVSFVQFLLTLEDNIDGLMFDPDQISQQSFNTVGTLVAYIESYTCTAQQ
ncbi:acyl carrier protein [Pectobacteriaceae bacterium CE70]|uniref:Acyl carrier protein n=1 Tax=Serratia sp. (strain ATCC 39006) TaxID=104623 RepID=A0A2I5T9H4_SERS3|nr:MULTISPECIES: acyl carrier protein [Enterobacterales]WJV64156.1 acyl carrier protein [Pectobacteriaceae bacterium C52]WJV65413.1 acyl carrier protein [Pectobacteriaceae bacterium CE70]WJY09430.1 acyl carrier protein [Pectobacteriaceae bacterium C80]AUH01227.1 acyl carrier protein [Serratia sp. ATCC 39006]AUH05548.1 acyl carrier protein [Serratia sp. ATCC 39006]